jgi:predicted dehydrogenase
MRASLTKNLTELAKDPNVDLVVSSVRVDRHAATVRSSIVAGKDVFVEWPLEANLSKARELTEFANKHNVRAVVGYQGRFTPLATKLRSLIRSGRIGNLESSTFYAAAPGGSSMISTLDYLYMAMSEDEPVLTRSAASTRA